MSEATAIALRATEDIELGTLRASTPTALISAASEIATPLAKMIRERRLANTIQGREYVRCEGWTTMGAMLGVIPQEASNIAQPDGVYVATVELVNIRTGAIVGRASAECGAPDELDRQGKPVWSNRPAYARRSMAATRATSKAFRLSFSWIMALAGYEPTPAEEMVDVHERQQAHDAPRDTVRAAVQRSLPDGAPVWRGKLVKMDTKNGKKANGDPWKLWKFANADGDSFGTFSETIAQGLIALEGHFVEIVYEVKKNGNEITEYRGVDLEEVPL